MMGTFQELQVYATETQDLNTSQMKSLPCSSLTKTVPETGESSKSRSNRSNKVANDKLESVIPLSPRVNQASGLEDTEVLNLSPTQTIPCLVSSTDHPNKENSQTPRMKRYIYFFISQLLCLMIKMV